MAQFFYSNEDFRVLMSFAIAQTKKINTPLPQSRKCPVEILDQFNNGEQQGTANVYF